jgi:FAD/FMN-containing dehydrogenase
LEVKVLQQMVEKQQSVPKHIFSGDADVMDWSGFFSLGKQRRLCQPLDEEELRSVLRNAVSGVRPLGSRLSQSALLRLDRSTDLLLDLSCLRGMIRIEEGSVTFGAATRLDEVYRSLLSLGRMLPCCPGVIPLQTLAGALATGTHGQGLHQSSFAETVLSFRIVLADGGVAHVDETHPWFAAALLSLGTLGIVSEVTLRTVPIQIYTCSKRTFTDEDLEQDLDRWMKEQPHTKAWWFPEEHQVHVWQAGPATAEEANRYNIAGRKPTATTPTDTTLNDAVDRSLARMRRDTKDDGAGKQLKTLERFRNVSDVTGDLFQIFCNGIAAPQINLEIALPLHRVGAVIGQLRNWHEENRPNLHYPIILRPTGPSVAWLSPARDEAVCYFGFVVYYAADRSISEEGVAYLGAVEKILAAEGGRPHWAKPFHPDLYTWPSLFPRWQSFKDVREMADPKGKFMNQYLRQLFGVPA